MADMRNSIAEGVRKFVGFAISALIVLVWILTLRIVKLGFSDTAVGRPSGIE